MSAPVPQPSLPDWQELLLEAIQQRDEPRAVVLAQRCVHRYGMNALATLLESADRGQGQDGDFRAWLLPLLTQSTPQSEASPNPPGPTQPQQPTFQPLESQPPTPQPTVEERPPSLAPAALDEAFAPLEIAFPPLPPVGAPMPERHGPQRPVVETSVSAAAPEVSGPVTPSLSEEQAEDKWGAEDPKPELTFEAAAEDGQTDADEAPAHVDAVVEAPNPPDGDEEVVAAPQPTFQLNEASDRLPSTRRSRHLERRVSNRPAPIPPALEPWLVWLPGAYRSRPRS